MKLSIIIPVYNEKATLSQILERVRAVDLGNIEKEIILVDDCSKDGSRDLVAAEAKVPGTHAFFHTVNQGKGAAIRTALTQCSGDYIIIQDADLEYDPKDYTKLLDVLRSGQADVVYGSRFMVEKRVKMTFSHLFGNKLLTFMMNLLYGTSLTDMETCYKLCKAELIKPIPLRSRRFEFEPEITAKLLKRHYRILEVPITYTGRRFDEGKKISWRDGFIAIWTIVKYRFVD